MLSYTYLAKISRQHIKKVENGKVRYSDVYKVTIPADVMKALNLKAGEQVRITIEKIENGN